MAQSSKNQDTFMDNGRDVFDLLAWEKFDCILMDVQMPKMDGVKATQEIIFHIETRDS